MSDKRQDKEVRGVTPTLQTPAASATPPPPQEAEMPTKPPLKSGFWSDIKHPNIAFILWVMGVSISVNLIYLFTGWFKVNSPMIVTEIWEGIVLTVNAIMPLMIFGVAWGQYRRWQKMLQKILIDSKKDAGDSKPNAYEYSLIRLGRWISLGLMLIVTAFVLSVGLISLSITTRYAILFGITLVLAVLAWLLTLKINTLKDEADPKNAPKTDQPKTQQPLNLEPAEWIRELPLNAVEKITDYVYIKPDEQVRIVKKFKENHGAEIPQEEIDAAVEGLNSDIQFLQKHLISKFRDRDYDAKYNQTLYRRYQISYTVLAALAGIFGALLALNVNQIESRGWVVLFGFLETLVALGTVYLATIAGRESPLQEWLTNRQKAEGLRREYQRYIVNLSPYQGKGEIERQRLLKMRASAIDLLGTPDANETEIFEALKQAGDQINAKPSVTSPTPPPAEPKNQEA